MSGLEADAECVAMKAVRREKVKVEMRLEDISLV